jgi:hypothetical protein
MCTIRFYKEALNMTIRSLYPGPALITPVYCSKHATCRVSSHQQTDADEIMEANFELASMQKDFKGVLLCKLQRKHTVEPDNHLNNSTVFVEDTATSTYLLVVWNVENECDTFYVCLTECTDGFIWDEDKLWTLRQQYYDQFLKDYNYKIITWLMHDGVVMKTRCDVTYGSDYKLNIVISEEAGRYVMRRPTKINPKWLVLSLLMLIVLIYTVGLPIPLLVKLNIHNQCLNVDLVSPTYTTTNELECHRPPDYKVRAGDTMRSNLMVKSYYKPYGILIYKIQIKQEHESTETEDISNDVHLLVAWKFSEFKKLFADVLLVEHAKDFVWNEDKLKKPYYKNHGQLRKHNNTISDTWLVGNNIVLKTTFSARDLKEDTELSISISEEEKGDYAVRPFYIHLER